MPVIYYKDLFFQNEEQFNDVISKVHTQHSPLIHILYQNGLRLYRLNDYSNSLKYFQMVIDIDPKFDYGRVFLNINDCLINMNLLDDVKYYYEKALVFIDDDWDAMIGCRIDYGLYLNLFQDFANADKFFSEALDLIKDPRNVYYTKDKPGIKQKDISKIDLINQYKSTNLLNKLITEDLLK